MALIELRNVTKAFTHPKGELLVMENVTFDIEDKEFLAVVGASGCGKSTLLRIISGLEHPSHGEVFFHGKPIIEPSTAISMVFQNFALLPWKTAKENVILALETKNLSLPEKEKIADKFLKRVGLEAFKDVYPSELSGGQRQRVGLARALAVEPDVLLLDEPFSSLDEITATELRKLLLDVWKDRTKTDTFVLITHLVEEAVLLADRVIVMKPNPGRVVGSVKIDIPRPRFDYIREQVFFNKVDEIKELLKKEDHKDDKKNMKDKKEKPILTQPLKETVSSPAPKH